MGSPPSLSRCSSLFLLAVVWVVIASCWLLSAAVGPGGRNEGSVFFSPLSTIYIAVPCLGRTVLPTNKLVLCDISLLPELCHPAVYSNIGLILISRTEVHLLYRDMYTRTTLTVFVVSVVLGRRTRRR